MYLANHLHYLNFCFFVVGVKPIPLQVTFNSTSSNFELCCSLLTNFKLFLQFLFVRFQTRFVRFHLVQFFLKVGRDCIKITIKLLLFILFSIHIIWCEMDKISVSGKKIKLIWLRWLGKDGSAVDDTISGCQVITNNHIFSNVANMWFHSTVQGKIDLHSQLGQ